MKLCTGCKRKKPSNAFYSHAETADGLMSPCKTCRRKAAKDRYKDPVSYKRITQYERKRAKDPSRRARAAEYQRAMRRRHPGKYRARTKVNNALRDGKITRGICWCGSPETEAHHTDYRRPLHIKWLCRKHHDQAEEKRTNFN